MLFKVGKITGINFIFFDFLIEIRNIIYTNNLTENLNKMSENKLYVIKINL